MRLLNKTHYGDLPNRTKEAYEVMCECQNQVLLDPNPLTFAAASVASDRWNKLARIEEKFYRQKSCIRWLHAGDLNTAFFHRSVQSRLSRNTIRMLKHQNGHELTASADIAREAWSIRGHRSRRFRELHAKIQDTPVPDPQMGDDKINPDWSDMLQVVCGEAYTLMDQILIRLLFQVVVYHVWRERNLRRHQQGFKGTDQLISMISKVVKNRISLLGYKGHHILEGLMRRWFEVFG
ncbi:hypothetical protein IGI04_036966 [Brassica rapa subsp. trilocularis]|uniref:Uncharacterized protein n=1 Tax=Brassica rapa subsp. trilocularis TaxID=1813537 RepID=A0ABQ7LI83_BRACM|nr:hypothetical protein IGI04_036966 [Brassica rapa subsp. trilocularis]